MTSDSDIDTQAGYANRYESHKIGTLGTLALTTHHGCMRIERSKASGRHGLGHGWRQRTTVNTKPSN